MFVSAALLLVMFKQHNPWHQESMRAALQSVEWPLEHQSTEVSLCHKDAQQNTENVIYKFCVHVGDGVMGISEDWSLQCLVFLTCESLHSDVQIVAQNETAEFIIVAVQSHKKLISVCLMCLHVESMSSLALHLSLCSIFFFMLRAVTSNNCCPV